MKLRKGTKSEVHLVPKVLGKELWTKRLHPYQVWGHVPMPTALVVGS